MCGKKHSDTPPSDSAAWLQQQPRAAQLAGLAPGSGWQSTRDARDTSAHCCAGGGTRAIHTHGGPPASAPTQQQPRAAQTDAEAFWCG